MLIVPWATESSGRTGFRVGGPFAWWIVAAVLVGVVGWMKTINILLLVSYTLVALLILNAILAVRALRTIAARRLPQAPVFAGETVAQPIEITGPAGASRSLTVSESAPAAVGHAWEFPRFTGSTVIVLRRTSFPQRGRQSLPPLVAGSGYPFGLLAFQRAIAAAGEQLVLPALGTVQLRGLKRQLLRAGRGVDRARRFPVAHLPQDGDVRGIRNHRTGDGVRDIHWKSSARRGQWMVREYDQTAPLDLIVIVDAWLPGLPIDRAAQRKLEWVLSLAASVAWTWVREEEPRKFTLILIENAAGVRSGPATPAFVREALGMLAAATGSPSTAAESWLRAPELRHPAARLCISTRPASPVAQQLRRVGLATATVDPSEAPNWFAPPPGVELRGSNPSGASR